jgi:ribulose-phosphate 3-epimerase
MKVSVSFLNSCYDFYKTVDLIDKSNADFIHIDVMDGLFVNNKTNFNKDMIEYLKKCKIAKDVHLMTLHLTSYIDVFSYIKPDYITYSFESTTNHDNIIDYIKSKGIKVGIAVNPLTDIKMLKPYLNKIDLVLVMSVIPGYGGQKFISDTPKRVSELFNLRNKLNANFIINVDGGINDLTIKKFKNGDLDMAVSGSFICNSNNYNLQINKLK